MRSPPRPRRSFMVPAAIAAMLAALGTNAEARPRTHSRPAGQSASQQSFMGGSEGGQSMIRQQPGSLGSAAIGAGGAGYAHARPGFIGGADDGQSIRRTQPRHHGGNHPHRGR